MKFYDRPEAERVEMTRDSIARRRTVMERWEHLDHKESRPWAVRAEKAAAFLGDCASVADLGCGTMGLRPFLAPGTRYVPVDVVSRGEGTVVLDLNREPLPDLDVDGHAALGLLEYLFDVPALLRAVPRRFVTSYVASDLDASNRLAHAWVNGYTVAEMETLFRDAGWRILDETRLPRQMIWSLTR